MARRRSSVEHEPRARARGSRLAASRGYVLIELLVVATIVAVTLAISVPALERAADTADAAGAARYLASVVARARFDAARQQRTVAVRFTRGASPTFSVAVDGDGDGVTAADVAAGIDRIVRGADRLEDHFPRARFGVAGGMPAIDESRLLTSADDPIRLGTAGQLSLGPLGTATSGTIYIASRHGVQFAVRVAGVTGRARVLRYAPGHVAWQPY